MIQLVEAKDVITNAVDAAFEFAKPLDRGDTLPFEDLERCAGCGRYTAHWQSFLKKFAKKLRDERGIAILSVMGVGYKLATKEEQLTECPRRRQRRILKQATRGKAEIESLPVEELSIHQQKRRAMTMDHLSHTRRVAMRAMREQTAERKRGGDIPVRPKEMLVS